MLGWLKFCGLCIRRKDWLRRILCQGQQRTRALQYNCLRCYVVGRPMRALRKPWRTFLRKLEAILVSRSQKGVRGVSNDLTVKQKKD